MAYLPTCSTYAYTLGEMSLSFVEMTFFILSNTNFVAKSPRRTMLINPDYQHKKGRGSVAVVGEV